MIVIGEKLPEEIISLIKNSSTPDERRTICNKHNLSIDLINALLRKDRNVTSESVKVVSDVIIKCKTNINSNLKLLKKYEQNGIKTFL